MKNRENGVPVAIRQFLMDVQLMQFALYSLGYCLVGTFPYWKVLVSIVTLQSEGRTPRRRYFSAARLTALGDPNCQERVTGP